jgi:hypothetical protein
LEQDNLGPPLVRHQSLEPARQQLDQAEPAQSLDMHENVGVSRERIRQIQHTLYFGAA